MTQKIILATSNLGKVSEFERLMTDWKVEFIPQSAYQIPDAVEDGATFVENALIKARHASRLTGLPALADDSGLCVKKLKGAPGVYSARYAGEHGNGPANIAKLLQEMEGVPEAERDAYFVCCLAYLNHPDDPTPIISQAFWRGHIVESPRGNNGFGYDPIFYVPTHHCSAAELSSEVKDKFSHRAQAMAQFKLLFGQQFSV